MKTKYTSGLLLLFLLFIFSCKKELVPQESSGVNLPSATENATVSPIVSPATNVNAIPNASILKENSSVNTLALNPPHGQAGHRCDIAVGAPLNSPPNKVISKSAPNPQVSTILNSSTIPVVTKPGMNPPHGQAGHRCDIAVGAPLNSVPNKVIPPPVVRNTAPNSQVPAILKLDTTAIAPKP